MSAPEPGSTDANGYVFAIVGEEIIRIIPMIFNDRLTIGPLELDHQEFYHGWCYDKGGAAYLAASLWDPIAQDEPMGYKKKATPGHRVAPDREDRS